MNEGSNRNETSQDDGALFRKMRVAFPVLDEEGGYLNEPFVPQLLPSILWSTYKIVHLPNPNLRPHNRIQELVVHHNPSIEYIGDLLKS